MWFLKMRVQIQKWNVMTSLNLSIDPWSRLGHRGQRDRRTRAKAQDLSIQMETERSRGYLQSSKPWLGNDWKGLMLGKFWEKLWSFNSEFGIHDEDSWEKGTKVDPRKTKNYTEIKYNYIWLPSLLVTYTHAILNFHRLTNYAVWLSREKKCKGDWGDSLY